MTSYGLDERFSMINYPIALKFGTRGAVLLEEYICIYSKILHRGAISIE